MPVLDTTPLVVEQLIDADGHRVWLALTEKEQLKKWCFDIPSFMPEAGHSFQFYGEKDGTSFLHLCRVVEVLPYKKMRWLWTYEGIEGQTFVTFELIGEESKTRLVLTHEGLHNLPHDENYGRQNFEGGWATIIGQLLPQHLAAK